MFVTNSLSRALEAGAWGYVSKADGENNLIKAIESIAAGTEIVLRPTVRAIYNQD